jgi:thiol-disulfide isomerase/thioredoxin
LAAAIAVLSGCGEPGRAPEKLPQLAFTALDGTSVPLARYAGRPLVLNLWATWCEPCREEMPSLQRLDEMYDDAALRVVAVSVDDDANLVREFVLRYRLTLPVLLDPGGQRMQPLRIAAYPTTLLVAGDGRIAATVTGGRDWSSAQTLEQIGRVLGVSAPAAHPRR